MTAPRMTDEQYLITQDSVLTLARLVQCIDLEGFVERINLAETIGPIADPTLAREAAPKLSTIKRLAYNALLFKRIVIQERDKLASEAPQQEKTA